MAVAGRSLRVEEKMVAAQLDRCLDPKEGTLIRGLAG
jgi:hypothetical protein